VKVRKIIPRILLALSFFYQSVGFAINNQYYLEKKELFNQGTGVSSADIPEYGIANTLGASIDLLEGQHESRAVFSKKIDATGATLIRISLVTNSLLTDEEVAANFKACDGIVPPATLDQNSNIFYQWQSYAGMRFLNFGRRNALAQGVHYLRSSVRDGKKILVGRFDVNEIGWSYKGLQIRTTYVLENFYWTTESIRPITPKVGVNALCGNLTKPGEWVRVSEFVYYGGGSNVSRYRRL
jgi:hypothetical protein